MSRPLAPQAERPAQGAALTRVTPVRLDEERARRLAHIARALEWTPSEVLRQALDHFWEALRGGEK